MPRRLIFSLSSAKISKNNMATPATPVLTSLPTVILIGRVNVGKSTLFNRLIEEDKAIVSSIPGTTRTSNEGLVLWRGAHFRLVDTGGLTLDSSVPFEKDIEKQAERAVKEADLILFVTDAKIGLLPEERMLAKRLRKMTKTPLLLVANKVDNPIIERKLDVDAWQQLGYGRPVLVSGASGRAVGDLLDVITDNLQKQERAPVEWESDTPAIRVSIIGKPNVGKSSLFNALIGEDKVIVSDTPHTTREPHDMTVVYRDESDETPKEQRITFVDTAGIRRKAKVGGDLERQGIRKSIKAIESSDIVLFVLDASEPIAAQDMQLGGLLEARAKSVIIILNKWDLATDNTDEYRNKVKKAIYSQFPHLDFAPIVFTSAKTRYRTHQLFPLLMHAWATRHTEIPRETIAIFFKQVLHAHRPMRGRGSRFPELLGMRQIDTNPPVFEILIKQKTSLHESYTHYLKHRLRDQFDFTATPIIITLTKMKR